MSKEMEAAKFNRRRKSIVEEGGDADITPLGVFCDSGHRVYHAYLANYCDKACRVEFKVVGSFESCLGRCIDVLHT